MPLDPSKFGSKRRVLLIKQLPCLVCHQTPSDNAHVISRGRGGKQNDIVPLCVKHHQELDGTSTILFQDKYNINLAEKAKQLEDILKDLEL